MKTSLSILLFIFLALSVHAFKADAAVKDVSSGIHKEIKRNPVKTQRVGQVAYMLAPDGNQVEVVSIPGKKLITASDLEFDGDAKIVMAGPCANSQKDLNLRLGLTEYELELRLLIQKLRAQNKPRRLSKVQSRFISEVPACEDFQWELAIISKLLKNYDLVKSRQVSLK